MKRISPSICCAFGICVAIASAVALAVGKTQAAAAIRGGVGFQEVPLVRVIANPEHFDGKSVCVYGYCTIEPEGFAIYMHADDRKFMLTQNGVWLALGMPGSKVALSDQVRALDGKYVMAIGTYSAGETGHEGLFSGALVEIERIAFWSDMEGWKPSGQVGELK